MLCNHLRKALLVKCGIVTCKLYCENQLSVASVQSKCSNNVVTLLQQSATQSVRIECSATVQEFDYINNSATKRSI